MTINHCCYSAYADVGHSDDCPKQVKFQNLLAMAGHSLLRPATKPPKPHLRRSMGIWTCQTANVIAKGRTPAEAYRDWYKANVMRGADVMRSLRPFA